LPPGITDIRQLRNNGVSGWLVNQPNPKDYDPVPPSDVGDEYDADRLAQQIAENPWTITRYHGEYVNPSTELAALQEEWTKRCPPNRHVDTDRYISAAQAQSIIRTVVSQLLADSGRAPAMSMAETQRDWTSGARPMPRGHPSYSQANGQSLVGTVESPLGHSQAPSVVLVLSVVEAPSSSVQGQRESSVDTLRTITDSGNSNFTRGRAQQRPNRSGNIPSAISRQNQSPARSRRAERQRKRRARKALARRQSLVSTAPSNVSASPLTQNPASQAAAYGIPPMRTGRGPIQSSVFPSRGSQYGSVGPSFTQNTKQVTFA
jgi:hypothetical protein